MKQLIAAISLGLLAACTTVQAAPGRQGSVALGEAIYVDGVTVTPERVIEDSRCPMNARCIWAGRVILRAEVRGGSWRRTLELTLGEPEPVADGTLTLVSVTPEMMVGMEIPRENYRFAFAFAGGL